MAATGDSKTPHRTPSVVVSLPCPVCGTRAEPDDDCTTCAGDGIVLRRVPAAEAGRPTEELRTLGEAWPPDRGDTP